MRQNRENKRKTKVREKHTCTETVISRGDRERQRCTEKEREVQMWDKGHGTETGANTQKGLGWENKGQRIARGRGSGRSCAEIPLHRSLVSGLSQGTKKGRESKASLTSHVEAALETRMRHPPCLDPALNSVLRPCWPLSTDRSPPKEGKVLAPRGRSPRTSPKLPSLRNGSSPAALSSGRQAQEVLAEKTCGGFKLLTLRSEFLKAP